MQPFSTVEGVAVPFDRANVDTDQIIPARFIMKPRDYDYSTLLFHDLRFGPCAEPDFPLDLPAYRGAQILVAAANFGCGSAREQAAYALQDTGIRAVIAPSFGGIFYTNCVKNGILPAIVEEKAAGALCAVLLAAPGTALTIDLEGQRITGPGEAVPFQIGESEKSQLLSGKDDITRTLEHEARIEAFEQALQKSAKWTSPPVSGAIGRSRKIPIKRDSS